MFMFLYLTGRNEGLAKMCTTQIQEGQSFPDFQDNLYVNQMYLDTHKLAKSAELLFLSQVTMFVRKYDQHPWGRVALQTFQSLNLFTVFHNVGIKRCMDNGW